MKNLVIYSSKYGCTEKCAKMLGDKLKGETILASADEKNLPNPSDFNNVILGSSIIVEKIGNNLSKYIEKNLETLKKSRLGLFVCAGNAEADYIGANFPEELHTNAVSKEYFGGELDMNKLNFFVRFMMKLIGKGETFSRIQENNISQMAAVINK